MPNPNVSLNIQDPGLGIVPASAGKTQVKLGVAQKGTPYTLYTAGSPTALKAAIGSGPLLETGARVLKSRGQLIMVPLEPTSFGTVTSSFALTGSGTGTIAGSRGPEQIARIKIGTGGALGTMTFQTALGAGAGGYGALATSGAGAPYAYRVPGQSFTLLSFAAGTYVANDVFTVNLDGTVTRVGTGTATLLDGTTNSPVDGYDIYLDIMTTGALGAGAFAYSLDGGNSFSPSLLIPASGKYVIPNTGIVLTFAGTFTVGDRYKGVATPAGYTLTELNLGLTALKANPSEWGFLHVVGKPANAAAALTLASAVGTVMDEFESVKLRYVFGIVECPAEEGISTLNTTFANFVHPRIGVAAGDVGLTSAVSLRTEKRNVAWEYTAGLSRTKLSIHPGETTDGNGAGPMRGVQSLYHDEDNTPGLDPARFVTARTMVGKIGYFITRGRMMAAPGSDFEQVMHRRVMDRACTVGRAALADFVNQANRMDPATGFIIEKDLQKMESLVEDKLNAALLSEDEVSSIKVTASRTDNVLSTKTLTFEIEIVPKGYSETIKATIGFKNPALSSAA